MSPMLSRRTVLRGLGATLAVPFLESLAPRGFALAAPGKTPGKPPVRMAVLYFANGVHGEFWTPKGTGKSFELSPTMAPLKDHKDDLLVMSELMNAAARTGDGHYVKTAGLLTGTTITKTTGKDLRSGGTSVDQVVAQQIGQNTPLPSLELGIEPVETGIDGIVGYTRLYGSHISWATPTTPLGKEINPQLAFDRLFRSDARAEGDNRSVLDLVSEDAKSLRGKVGGADQAKLDNYLESVRAVEKRIEFNTKQRAEEHKLTPQQLVETEALQRRITEFMEGSPAAARLKGDNDGQRRGKRNGGGADHSEHVRLMLDLMVLAFWSDSTRVGTFMFGNAVSPRNFSFLDGVKGGHHEISHHKKEENALAMYRKINEWHVAQYAYMLGRMKQIKEPDGSTLLDNSMVLFGSSIRDGDQHNPHNLPLILAGKAGGTIATGRHVQYEKNTPLCNLYTSMLDRMGAKADRFGDSTGRLKGLDDASFGGAA